MGAPYWPESFWLDLRHEMQTTDLVPVIARTYQNFISAEMMHEVNTYLKTHTIAQLAGTPLGGEFCALQQRADQDGKAATLGLTQETFKRVYERDNAEIRAARARYLRDHPDFHD